MGEGGEKQVAFIETTDVMPEDAFWKLIHSSHKMAEGDFETQQEILGEKLRKLTPQEIILFDNQFRKLRGEACTWDIWGAAYIINGGCGDDSFMDFRGWLIAQGEKSYARTRSNPDTLAKVDPDRFDVDWEGMDYIPGTVFKDITGKELPRGYREKLEATGDKWDEDSADLKGRLPLLWKKYN